MSHESIGYICTRKTRHLSIIHTNGTDHGFRLPILYSWIISNCGISRNDLEETIGKNPRGFAKLYQYFYLSKYIVGNFSL